MKQAFIFVMTFMLFCSNFSYGMQENRCQDDDVDMQENVEEEKTTVDVANELSFIQRFCEKLKNSGVSHACSCLAKKDVMLLTIMFVVLLEFTNAQNDTHSNAHSDCFTWNSERDFCCAINSTNNVWDGACGIDCERIAGEFADYILEYRGDIFFKTFSKKIFEMLARIFHEDL